MSERAAASASPRNTPDFPRPVRSAWSQVNWALSVPFFAVHVLALAGLCWLGFSWAGVLMLLLSYFVRMFGVTAGYHRYFAHKTYKTSRVFQFLLALLAVSSVQKGVLWWASHHRHHHKFSDTERDVHSMKRRGFWWSHMLWILSDDYHSTDLDAIQDFAKYPELRWLDKYHQLVSAITALLWYLAFGWTGFVYGFLVATVLLWHGTFTINSLAHWLGKRRFRTTDESRNSAILALITLGEGWHNNHHFYMRSVNQGFYWWEFDPTYYVLRMLSWVGLVWELHTPPKELLARAQRADESDAAFRARLLQRKLAQRRAGAAQPRPLPAALSKPVS